MNNEAILLSTNHRSLFLKWRVCHYVTRLSHKWNPFFALSREKFSSFHLLTCKQKYFRLRLEKYLYSDSV